VTFSLCEALPGGVSFWGAGLMALLTVAQLSTLDGRSGVSGSTGEVVLLPHLLIGRPGSVVGAARGLATGPLSKPAVTLGPSRLCTSRGKLPENGSPSERGPDSWLTGFLLENCHWGRNCVVFLIRLRRQWMRQPVMHPGSVFNRRCMRVLV